MNLVYYCGWVCFRTLYKTYFRARMYNVERAPETGPVIIASNHASFLDPPLVGSCLHRSVSYLARDTLFRYPGCGWLLRKWESVPVDREGGGAAGLRAILDRLVAGGATLLFPEGTRTLDGKLQPARSGIGLVVIKSTAPVVPVRVFGTLQAFGKHVPFPLPYQLTAKFGAPMDFARLRAEAKNCSKARLKDIYQQVADEIMAAIAKLEPHEDKATFP